MDECTEQRAERVELVLRDYWRMKSLSGSVDSSRLLWSSVGDGDDESQIRIHCARRRRGRSSLFWFKMGSNKHPDKSDFVHSSHKPQILFLSHFFVCFLLIILRTNRCLLHS